MLDSTQLIEGCVGIMMCIWSVSCVVCRRRRIKKNTYPSALNPPNKIFRIFLAYFPLDRLENFATQLTRTCTWHQIEEQVQIFKATKLGLNQLFVSSSLVVVGNIMYKNIFLYVQSSTNCIQNGYFTERIRHAVWFIHMYNTRIH